MVRWVLHCTPIRCTGRWPCPEWCPRRRVIITPVFRESEVAFVLAKQFKSARTGEGLGFPAYSRHGKELLGFYREVGVGVAQFVPLSHHGPDHFGPAEIADAVRALQEGIRNKSEAVHALKDWGSMASLMDHVLVYDWSKGIGGSGGHHAQSGTSTPSN